MENRSPRVLQGWDQMRLRFLNSPKLQWVRDTPHPHVGSLFCAEGSELIGSCTPGRRKASELLESYLVNRVTAKDEDNVFPSYRCVVC